MSITYGPFSVGSGATFSDDGWSSLLGAAIPDGVIDHPLALIALNKFAVTADNTILGVHVATGRAVVRGNWVQSDATTDVLVSAAHATLVRLDWIVLQLDRSAHTIAFAVVAGTPSGSPVAPALVRSGSVWQIPLAQVRVEAATSLIASNKVTDTRIWARSVNTGSAAGPVTQTGITATGAAWVDVTDMLVTLMTDGGVVEVDFTGIGFGAAANWVATYLSIDGGAVTAALGQAFSTGTNETGSVSFHYSAGVLAAGLHTFKIRANVSGGSGSIQAGRQMTVKEFR